MLEKQRVHLEELIIDFEQVVLFTTEHRDKKYARKQRDLALKDITDYMGFIQSYMGTQKCASCGCSPNQLSSDVELGPCDCWDCTKRREVLKDE